MLLSKGGNSHPISVWEQNWFEFMESFPILSELLSLLDILSDADANVV